MATGEDLPDLVTSKIVDIFVEASVFELVSLAGVCSGWRGFVKELRVPHLVLDSTLKFKESCTRRGAPFWSLGVGEKTAFFEAATQLIRKHTRVSCSGAAISDRTVLNLANSSVESLTLEVSHYTPRGASLRCLQLSQGGVAKILLLMEDFGRIAGLKETSGWEAKENILLQQPHRTQSRRVY